MLLTAAHRTLPFGTIVDVKNSTTGKRCGCGSTIAGRSSAIGSSIYTSPVRPGNGKTDVGTTLSSWELDRDLAACGKSTRSLSVLARPDEGMQAKAGRIFADAGEIVPSLRPSFCSAHDRMYIFDPSATSTPAGSGPAILGSPGPRDARGRRRASRSDQVAALAHPHRRQQSGLSALPLRPALRRRLRVLALEQARKAFNSNYCDGFAYRFRASVAEAFLEHVSGAGLAPVQARVCDL